MPPPPKVVNPNHALNIITKRTRRLRKEKSDNRLESRTACDGRRLILEEDHDFAFAPPAARKLCGTWVADRKKLFPR
ncbi:hypothetical protein L596_007677 [Steinernema carpocapsae]|uniref:Uncharacterized protein n=1 Tax=Steinernema carpocapsae TaxID=34508 RepID=A0A4U5PAP3_STECR|nr:hypothetical protein L596_007677 [Steinernema carpocapsae]